MYHVSRSGEGEGVREDAKASRFWNYRAKFARREVVFRDKKFSKDVKGVNNLIVWKKSEGDSRGGTIRQFSIIKFT